MEGQLFDVFTVSKCLSDLEHDDKLSRLIDSVMRKSQLDLRTKSSKQAIASTIL
jgi:hypothetical protein